MKRDADPEPLPALVRRLRSGELSPADYLDWLEARFAEREPAVQAFLPEPGRFERLRREAGDLVRRFPEPASRPPLFGVPVGVKDIFHVTSFTTRAGSRLPAELLQGTEAESVTRLKAAGALILGKTVTTEFAYFAPGPTRNPRNPGHTPGGSSSGSAAAVAAGLCPLALGTQTIGSIVRPAAFCGVVGFKPTFDRIPRGGVIPLAPSFDHVGGFAADVGGLALAAGVLGRDWRADRVAPAPAMLGIPEGPYMHRVSAETLAHFRAVCRTVAAAGSELKPVELWPDFEAVCARHFAIVNGEAARVHAGWFPRHRDLYHPKTLEKLESGRTIADEALAQAAREREEFRASLARVMQANRIDLWLAPAATGPAPRGLEYTGDPVMNLPWTQAGLPALCLPAGCAGNGLPLGLQLVARSGADESLLHWGARFERLLAARGA